VKSLLTLGVAVVIAAATLLFGFDQANPDTAKWALLHLVAVGAFVFIVWRGRHMVPQAVLWALGLFCFAALSLAWSSDPWGGAVELVNGAGLLAVFALVALCPRERLYIVLPIMVGCAVVAFVMGMIWPEFNGGFGNENFQTEYFILITSFLVAGLVEARRCALS